MPVEPIKSRVNVLLSARKMQRARHLRFGLTPRASVGHREGLGDAKWREEEVWAGRRDFSIEVEGEVCISRNLSGPGVLRNIRNCDALLLRAALIRQWNRRLRARFNWARAQPNARTTE